MGFPKIRGTLLGVPIVRIIVHWGLYWGPLILENYHISMEKYTGQFKATSPSMVVYIGNSNKMTLKWKLKLFLEYPVYTVYISN